MSPLHLSRLCPAVTPQALLFLRRQSKARLSPSAGGAPSLRQSCALVSVILRRPSQLFNKRASNSGCHRVSLCIGTLASSSSASAVHSRPVEKHLQTCRGGSPPSVCLRVCVRVRVCVLVCVWLVSHVATVIFLSDVCFSVRPDSDRDDLTTKRAACVFSCQQARV